MPVATGADTLPPPVRALPVPAVPVQAAPPAREALGTIGAPDSAPYPAAGDASPAEAIRIERGTASAEEVAAVTAVLLARAAAARAAAQDAQTVIRRPSARWRASAFAGARAWTADARDLLAS